jgi:predicted Zn-dependent peptidase
MRLRVVRGIVLSAVAAALVTPAHAENPAGFRRAVSAVTAEEVLRTVRTHWDADAMSLALIGNLREAGIQSP